MRWSGVLLAAALAAPASGLAQDLDAPDTWEKASRVQLALRHNERPLTMPHDVFDIFFDGGLTALSRAWMAASLGVGARYGVNDELEIGVRLLRLTMSEAPDTGIARPTVFSSYRFLKGPFEAALRLETEVPTSPGGLQLWLRIPMLARAGRFVRVDLAPAVSTTTGTVWGWSASAPVEISGQFTDRLRIFAVAEVGVPDLRRPDDLLMRAGGGLAWVFGSPTWEIAARLSSPTVALAGERLDDPAFGNYVGGLVTLRLFFQGPTEDPNDPLF